MTVKITTQAELTLTEVKQAISDYISRKYSMPIDSASVSFKLETDRDGHLTGSIQGASVSMIKTVEAVPVSNKR